MGEGKPLGKPNFMWQDWAYIGPGHIQLLEVGWESVRLENTYLEHQD